MTIKNIEYLKKCQITCRNQNQVKDCLNYLKQLGFDVEYFTEYCDGCNIIFWGDSSKKFTISNMLKRNLPIEFYNKELVKTLQKLIKEKEEKEKEKEKKEKLKDFEVAEDGRITKINNWESEKCLYFIGAWDYGTINFDDFKREGFEYYVNLGLAFISKEARDRAMFKLEIETKLKNIAERLNNRRKIDFTNEGQEKFYIFYNYKCKILDWETRYWYKEQGLIYCLDRNFLDVAKQEIGEENLIKYFKE